LVDATRALGLAGHETAVLEEAQMLGHRGYTK
jgi:hypothetical protein